MRLSSAALLLLLAAAGTADAQQNAHAPETARAAHRGAAPDSASPLGVFARLDGEWEGDAWMMVAPGRREAARQWERVTVQAGGTVITIEGRGVRAGTGGGEEVVHEAFAIMHLDHDGRTPLMRAFTSGGRWVDADLVVKSDGYEWSLGDPRGGRIRYEVTFGADGRWIERGYASRDEGRSWTQFMEMTLERKP